MLLYQDRQITRKREEKLLFVNLFISRNQHKSLLVRNQYFRKPQLNMRRDRNYMSSLYSDRQNVFFI